MTAKYTPIQEAALAAMVPVVALVAALDKKGVLSMPDLYEELSLIELNAAASGTDSARVLSEAAGTAKVFVASLHSMCTLVRRQKSGCERRLARPANVKATVRQNTEIRQRRLLICKDLRGIAFDSAWRGDPARLRPGLAELADPAK